MPVAVLWSVRAVVREKFVWVGEGRMIVLRSVFSVSITVGETVDSDAGL